MLSEPCTWSNYAVAAWETAECSKQCCYNKNMASSGLSKPLDKKCDQLCKPSAPQVQSHDTPVVEKYRLYFCYYSRLIKAGHVQKELGFMAS